MYNIIYLYKLQEIGPHWEQVVERCKRGRCQPLLLLYANPNGTPIESASNNKISAQNTNNMANNIPEQDSNITQLLPNQSYVQTMSHPNVVVNSNNFVQQNGNNQNYPIGIQGNQLMPSQTYSQNNSQLPNGSQTHHNGSIMPSMIRANTPSVDKGMNYMTNGGNTMTIQQQQMRRCLTPVVGNRNQMGATPQNDYQNLAVIQEAMSSNGIIA